MVKNIPNRMTQAEFKQFVDETSDGKYDFLYLRFDFQNRCNVGYVCLTSDSCRHSLTLTLQAFINFLKPEFIVRFAYPRLGIAWNVHASEKIADCCYANIQGRDRLVEKFRNSNVMEVEEAYRPRVYHNGKEIAFPKPNNPRKKDISTRHAVEIGILPSTSAAGNSASTSAGTAMTKTLSSASTQATAS